MTISLSSTMVKESSGDTKLKTTSI